MRLPAAMAITIDGVERQVVRRKARPRVESFEVIAPVNLRDTLALADRADVDIVRA